MRATSVIAPDISQITPPSLVLADLRVNVVTPMFGGGVRAGDLDHNHLVRGASVRGHLRFWWRAWNAGRYETLPELHAAEKMIWGSATDTNTDDDAYGAVTVRVSGIRAGGGEFNPDHEQGELGYVLFPFKTSNQQPEPKMGQQGIQFRLVVGIAPHSIDRMDALLPEVKNALWAWFTLGGVGARTRRGCGALTCSDYSLDTPIQAGMLNLPGANRETWLNGWLGQVPNCRGDGHALPGVPALLGARLAITSQSSDAMNAWRDAVFPLQQFAQGSEVGREPNMGHSRWPDVGAARRVAGYTMATGYDYLNPPHIPANHLPRLDLGLPRAITLQPGNAYSKLTFKRDQDDFERMPSPVIVKPLARSSQVAVSLVAVLNAPHLWEMDHPAIFGDWNWGGYTGDARVTLSPMGDNQYWPFPNTQPPGFDVAGVNSARDAFLEYASARPGWRRVS